MEWIEQLNELMNVVRSGLQNRTESSVIYN